MRYILPLFGFIIWITQPCTAQIIASAESLNDSSIEAQRKSKTTPSTYEKDIQAEGTMESSTLNGDSIVFNIGSVDAVPGETVCVPVTVENFDSVVAVTFAMKWNPLIFEFTEIQNIQSDFADVGLNTNNTNEGYFALNWLDLSVQGLNLPDGTVLFEVCFKAIGSPGEMTELDITSHNNAFLEVVTVNASMGAPVIVNQGKLRILSEEDLYAEYTSCSTPTGESSGSFTLTIFGGEPPYDVQWELSTNAAVNGMGTVNNYGESITFSDLAPTLGAPYYDVTITDNNGDVINIQVEIANAPSIDVQVGIDQALCPGSTNGKVSITFYQTNPPTKFEWNTGSFSPSISGLGPGLYSVTMTDGFGCEVSDSIQLEVDSVDLDATVEDATCKGENDGSITVNPSGGNPTQDGNYSFLWDDGTTDFATSSTLSNVTAGDYSVTVTDSTNCEYIETFTVEATQRIVVDELNIVPVSCHGAADGMIGISVTMEGGSASNLGYLSYWSPEFVVTNHNNDSFTHSSLPGGVYEVSIREFIGNNDFRCQLDTTLRVPEPDSLVATLTSKGDESCNQGNDGFISVNAQGGSPMTNSPFYDFQWSNGDSGITIEDLSAGDYTVTVTDANGCTDTMTVRVNQPNAPSITSFDSIPIRCHGENSGSLTVNYEVGNAPIQDISWSPSGSGETISGLSEGRYIVTITAEDGCFDVDTAYLTEPEPMVFDSLNLRNPGCPGESTGQIIAFVSGGTAPYTFNWSVSGSADDQVLPSLKAGTYTLTVLDANNCAPLDTTITLTDPPEISASFSNLTSTSCFNTCDGSATVQGSGGTSMNGNFTYMWSTGESGPTATALCPGENYVTVSDEDCAIVDTIFIDSPDSVKVSLLSNESVSCYGLSDGALEVMASGGTGPYDFSWDNSATQADISDLTAGPYTVEVTDANGCQTTSTYVVNEPDSLILEIDSANTFQISCGGYEDGLISLLYTGGNIDGPFDFNWSPDVSDGTTAADLGPGLYEITVSDENACSDTTSIRLSEPPPIRFSLPEPEEPNCYGEETQLMVSQASGGSGGPYSYTINNTGSTPIGQPIDVLAGTYLVSVFDGGGCAIDTQITIEQPNPVEVELGPDLEVPLGDSVLLQGEVTSDVPLDSFQWIPPDFLQCDTCLATYTRPFTDQMYTLSVTDENGCQGSDIIWVRINTTRQIYIPNTFTPNNDGINDRFEIFAGQGVAAIERVRIFNRWGDLVYEGRGLAPNPSGTDTWDGRFNNQRMEPGVYVYLVEVTFLDGQTLTFRGDVTLIR